MFFGFGLSILKNKGWKIARPYFAQLNNWENLLLIAKRYIIVKILDLINLKNKFYHILFYKGYYEQN